MGRRISDQLSLSPADALRAFATRTPLDFQSTYGFWYCHQLMGNFRTPQFCSVQKNQNQLFYIVGKLDKYFWDFLLNVTYYYFLHDIGIQLFYNIN
jgi:hypothetical protein